MCGERGPRCWLRAGEDPGPPPFSPGSPGAPAWGPSAAESHAEPAFLQPNRRGRAGGRGRAGARKEMEPTCRLGGSDRDADAPRSPLCAWASHRHPSRRDETGDAVCPGNSFATAAERRPGPAPNPSWTHPLPRRGPYSWGWRGPRPGDPVSRGDWRAARGGAPLSPVPSPAFCPRDSTLSPTTLTAGPERGWEPRRLLERGSL